MSLIFVEPHRVFERRGYAEYTEPLGLKHLIRVARAKVGEPVTFTDGDYLYQGRIKEISPDVCRFSIEEKQPIPKPTFEIDLYQGMPKGEKTDWIIQKTTELGIHQLSFVQTARTVVILEEKAADKKQQRFDKIALEACKQCGRADRPLIRTGISFKDMLEEIGDYDAFLVPYEACQTADASVQGLKETVQALEAAKAKKIGFFIGPEGGIAPEELEVLIRVKAQIVTLGTRVLRTETAGIAVLSVLQAFLGDMGE